MLSQGLLSRWLPSQRSEGLPPWLQGDECEESSFRHQTQGREQSPTRSVRSKRWARLRPSLLVPGRGRGGGRVAEAVLSPGILQGWREEGRRSGVLGAQLLATLPSIWMRLS